ncbi:cadherin-like protein 26 [Tenrec ecaudatus]|uniref:cadherin-like protein 26 n=1 Tax=Tenrec ecaudatus TaxID=94439 RepID=UPI003F5AB68E
MALLDTHCHDEITEDKVLQQHVMKKADAHSLLINAILTLKVSVSNSFQRGGDELADQVQVEYGIQSPHQPSEAAPHFKGESRWPLHRIKRDSVITPLELEEEDPGPFPKLVGEPFRECDEAELMYLMSGPGVDEDPEVNLFSMDRDTGKVYVHRSVDREKTPFFTVRFDVANRSTGKILDRSLMVTIKVNDVNDHEPRFLKEVVDVEVKESQEANLPIFQLSTVDQDQENTFNSKVLYFLDAQSPSLGESVFQIDCATGHIRFSGCLDYETAPVFTLLVTARDLGTPQLSSTATVNIHVQDGNNHRPEFIQEKYEIQIPEGRTDPSVLHIRVRDRDTRLTSAWRAKFSISTGNEEGHFGIATDPVTNEGILSVLKPLDHEMLPHRHLVISVENEERLFSCEAGKLRKPAEAKARVSVDVTVVDRNEPPVFHPETLIVTRKDGDGPGLHLGVVKAIDPDGTSSHVSYLLAHDPANWVSVDNHSGLVITTQQIDRESSYVKDNFYVITIHGIDDGVPPQTGTGTVKLFLTDINDNAPTIPQPYLEVCEPSVNKPLLIEAEDRDLPPYTHPFTFELDLAEREAEGRWKLGSNWSQNHRSVELLILKSLPLGDYLVPLRIGDYQGLSQRQTVHLRVCSCLGGTTCVDEPTTSPIVMELKVSLVLGSIGLMLIFMTGALLFLRRNYIEIRVNGCPIIDCPLPSRWTPLVDGVQTLLVCNEESKPHPTKAKDPMFPRILHLTLDTMLDILEDDPDPQYGPHVYAEEGESDIADTLSSLSLSEEDLPLDLLHSMGSRADALEKIFSS